MQIQLEHIKKSYRKKQVLTDICLEAESGTCIGILGTNGSGKSTLLSILAGVLSRDSGKFLCDGEDLFQDPRKRAELVGYVPQGTPLIEELSAKDNLLLWYNKAAMEQELEKGVLKMLGIGDFIKVPVKKMSGGMKKRLSIGCAMAKRPPILLLDEPTAALDLVCKEDISQYLTRYKKAGGILFLTTHDSVELSLCDRLYILKNGVLNPYTHDGELATLVKNL